MIPRFRLLTAQDVIPGGTHSCDPVTNVISNGETRSLERLKPHAIAPS